VNQKTFVLTLSTVVILTAFFAAVYGKKYQPQERILPELGKLEGFSLTDSHNRAFMPENMEDKVWVANFMFSECEGFCPAMTNQMKEYTREFAENDQFNLVSISVDPKNDSPDDLAKYAENQKIEGDKWHFLTGDEKSIKETLEKSFKVGFPNNPNEHVNYIILVDKKQVVRGYYSLSDAKALKQLPSDISVLLNN
tara:strand:+ start:385 stop:972 length:588 start_codon:yes stop_codon:yes gene_type:complete